MALHELARTAHESFVLGLGCLDRAGIVKGAGHCEQFTARVMPPTGRHGDETMGVYIVQIAADLRAGKLDGQLMYRKRLRRNLEEYTKNVPPHVQAARMQKRPGRVVAYYITANGPEPVELLRSPIDYKHYLERQLAPAADAILQCKGTDFMALVGQQRSLFNTTLTSRAT